MIFNNIGANLMGGEEQVPPPQFPWVHCTRVEKQNPNLKTNLGGFFLKIFTRKNYKYN